jgi:hypothetical protein
MTTENDRQLVFELEQYIYNDGTLYRQTRRPLELNYARKMVKGEFNKELAVKGIEHLVVEGIKRYEKEFRAKFQVSPAMRKKIAQGLLESMMSEINDTAKTMKALKKAGKPWTMVGGR